MRILAVIDLHGTPDVLKSGSSIHRIGTATNSATEPTACDLDKSVKWLFCKRGIVCQRRTLEGFFRGFKVLGCLHNADIGIAHIRQCLNEKIGMWRKVSIKNHDKLSTSALI